MLISNKKVCLDGDKCAINGMYSTLEDIIANAEEYFSNLIFCNCVIEQLKVENHCITVKQIFKRLSELQEEFSFYQMKIIKIATLGILGKT
ncbi:hypothetical protein [Anaeromicropila populeti]|uniref:hypothetical protein n=1 Tax=Anaeromicropila populeti TaxID=37658 RepID=UPI001A9A4637|nr:hypothetical protein [Anaeromicropila populeti]